MIFIYDVKTHRKVNNKGQEMCEFAQAYDRILVQDKCAMDSLKCEFEEVVKRLNEKYPNQKTLIFRSSHETSSGGQWSFKLGDDDSTLCALFLIAKFVVIILLEKILTC